MELLLSMGRNTKAINELSCDFKELRTGMSEIKAMLIELSRRCGVVTGENSLKSIRKEKLLVAEKIDIDEVIVDKELSVERKMDVEGTNGVELNSMSEVPQNDSYNYKGIVVGHVLEPIAKFDRLICKETTNVSNLLDEKAKKYVIDEINEKSEEFVVVEIVEKAQEFVVDTSLNVGSVSELNESILSFVGMALSEEVAKKNTNEELIVYEEPKKVITPCVNTVKDRLANEVILKKLKFNGFSGLQIIPIEDLFDGNCRKRLKEVGKRLSLPPPEPPPKYQSVSRSMLINQGLIELKPFHLCKVSHGFSFSSDMGKWFNSFDYLEKEGPLNEEKWRIVLSNFTGDQKSKLGYEASVHLFMTLIRVLTRCYSRKYITSLLSKLVQQKRASAKTQRYKDMYGIFLHYRVLESYVGIFIRWSSSCGIRVIASECDGHLDLSEITPDGLYNEEYVELICTEHVTKFKNLVKMGRMGIGVALLIANQKFQTLEDSINKTKLGELSRHHFTKSGKDMTNLKDCVNQMKENQNYIHYIIGEKVVDKSSSLGSLMKKGYKVLYMVGAIEVDDVDQLKEFENTKLISANIKGLKLNESEVECVYFTKIVGCQPWIKCREMRLPPPDSSSEWSNTFLVLKILKKKRKMKEVIGAYISAMSSSQVPTQNQVADYMESKDWKVSLCWAIHQRKTIGVGYEDNRNKIANVVINSGETLNWLEYFCSSYDNRWRLIQEEISMRDDAKAIEDFEVEYIYSHTAATKHNQGVMCLSLYFLEQMALNRYLFHWEKLQLGHILWEGRLNIALDVARGIVYPHNFVHQSFSYKDLEPANLLISVHVLEDKDIFKGEELIHANLGRVEEQNYKYIKGHFAIYHYYKKGARELSNSFRKNI